MTEFAVSIAGFDSDDARLRAACIIASSEGFHYSEDEALQLLKALPVRVTFEAELEKGEDTLERLGQAGCELSYSYDTAITHARNPNGFGNA